VGPGPGDTVSRPPSTLMALSLLARTMAAVPTLVDQIPTLIPALTLRPVVVTTLAAATPQVVTEMAATKKETRTSLTN